MSPLIFKLLNLNLATALGMALEADFMRSIGKIYVVVAVILVLFIGIFFFLINIDRKLSKLETQIFKDNEQ